MKAKLIVEGREFPIEIQDPELEKLLKPRKKTGYERVECGDMCYYDDWVEIRGNKDVYDDIDNDFYDVANYYSDRTLADNNSRADTLMRQLRRYAVEHRKYNIYWTKTPDEKWSIVYDCSNNRIIPYKHWDVREAFVIYFDTEETAKNAIILYHDELIWYFTEYKDSL